MILVGTVADEQQGYSSLLYKTVDGGTRWGDPAPGPAVYFGNRRPAWQCEAPHVAFGIYR